MNIINYMTMMVNLIIYEIVILMLSIIIQHTGLPTWKTTGVHNIDCNIL